jgi:hypothetical protein
MTVTLIWWWTMPVRSAILSSARFCFGSALHQVV